jgi:hypothetical protein
VYLPFCFLFFFVFTATETAIAQVPWPECPASNPNDICLSGQPYHFRDTRSPNNVNFTAGDRLVLGAEVQPNPIRPAGSDGSGTALIAQQSTTGPILLPFFGNSAFPDDFGISVAYDPGLTGSWQITIENPQSSNAPVVVNTPEVGNAGTQEFVKNMKLSGAGTTPTLSWTYPAGFVSSWTRRGFLISSTARSCWPIRSCSRCRPRSI